MDGDAAIESQPSTGILRRRPSLPVSGEESKLIAKAKKGSADAIEALVRRHWPKAHRIAYLIVHDEAAAEDVAQESIMATLETLDRFDGRRPLGPWLHRITANNAMKWLRTASRRRELSSEIAGVDEAVEGGLEGPEVSDEILGALAALAPAERAVVVLRYLIECTPGEIAEILDLPRGTVNSRLRRGLDRLATDHQEVFDAQ